MMKPIEKTIYSYLQDYTLAQGERTFLFDETRSYTVAKTLKVVDQLASFLYQNGVTQSSLVALRTTRSLDSAVIYLALQALGAVAVLCDPHDKTEKFLFESGVDLTPDFIITNEESDMDISASGGWLLMGKGQSIPLSLSDETYPKTEDVHSPSTIIFTSGSTGKSKGVVLSQYNLVNHIRNYSGAGSYFSDDVSPEILPIHHVFGLAVILMGLIVRYTIFFPKNVSVDYILSCIEQHRLTRLDGVPSFAFALAKRKEEKGGDTSSLRVGVLGGAPSSIEQFRYIEKMLSLKLVPVYGMSECIGISGIDLTAKEEYRSSSVGKFLPMTEGFILDENGEACPQGEIGEICVKCPAVMLGYFNDEDSTRLAIDEEGRLHSGDLGYLDEKGLLHIAGRKKDIIIRNGINISSGKIQNAICALPEVTDAIVVGIPDEKAGEIPCAFVVGSLTSDELIKKLKPVLAKNELPKYVLFGDFIPLTSSGKPDKQKIKEAIIQWKA